MLYLSDGNGNYTLFNTEKKSGKIGNEVTAVANTYQGYKFNPEVQGTVQSGVIAEDGSLVLKLYYDITEIETTKTQPSDTTTKKDDFAKTTVTSQDTINGQNQAKTVKVGKAKIKSAKITKKVSVKKLIITFKYRIVPYFIARWHYFICQFSDYK